MKVILLPLASALFLLSGGTAARAEAINPIAVIWEANFRALDLANAEFSAAWVAGDIDTLLAAYTDDAIVHPPAGGVLTTPEQIRGVWAPIVNYERIDHRLEPTLRRPLGDDRVLEMGRWHSARTNGAGQSPWQSGCYTVIWRNEAGRWRMQYDAWTAPNDASWACRPR